VGIRPGVKAWDEVNNEQTMLMRTMGGNGGRWHEGGGRGMGIGRRHL